MNCRWLVWATALLLLNACATQDHALYHWGAYQDTLYEGFRVENGNTSPEKQLQQLQQEQQKAASHGKALPPGFQAHMGYLFFQTGQSDQAVVAFENEKKQFPESSVYMDFVIGKLKKP
jgi:hypothetical protein